MNSKIKKKIIENVINSIVNVTGTKKIGLHEPHLGLDEKNYLKKCVDSKYVSYLGEFVEKFEKEISNYTGSKYVVSTNSGTSALHLACRLLNIDENSEVLMPALSFVAPANAVRYLGGYPHFVDIEDITLGIDSIKLEAYLKKITRIVRGECINKNTNKVIKAVIVVHAYGNPAQIDRIIKVAHKYKIKVIEDAAESFGSFYKNKHTGTFGDIGTLSFNGNKIITTGGGGALLLKSNKIYKRAKHLATTAKLKHAWEYVHDDIGFNYRMPNINAALGNAQIRKIKKLLKYKKNLALKYHKSFKHIKEIKIFKQQDHAESNYWLNTIILSKEAEELRDILIKSLHKIGLQVRPAWKPLNKLRMYRNCEKDSLDKTHGISKRLINLPSGYNIS